jgi:chemotaxis protein CheZ
MELESVVHATESAATRIMEAAEAIGSWLRTGRRDAESIEEVAEKVNAIFEACSFQDLTGQRIRRAIEHLQKVETMLEGMTQGHHPVPAVPEPEIVWGKMGTSTAPTAEGHDLAQDEIDSLFG